MFKTFFLFRWVGTPDLLKCGIEVLPYSRGETVIENQGDYIFYYDI